MTLKLLALTLSMICMVVTLSSRVTPSDAYQVGYAEGRFDLHTESRAMKKFYECFAEKTKLPGVDKKKVAETCWHDQIEWTKVLYRTWDAMTDQQKVDHAAQSNGGIKWADILRGKGDSNVMPPLPVEIK